MRVVKTDFEARFAELTKGSLTMVLRRFFPTSLAAALLAFASPTPALAYIGPGAGLGAIAVIVALGLGVVLLLAGLVWFPLKRFFKSRKGIQSQPDSANSQE